MRRHPDGSARDTAPHHGSRAVLLDRGDSRATLARQHSRPERPAETRAVTGPSGTPQFLRSASAGYEQSISQGGVSVARIKLDLDRRVGRLDRRVSEVSPNTWAV